MVHSLFAEEKESSGLFERRGSKHQPTSLSVIKEEMRIILMGSHADAKSSCGNTIFGLKVFSESPSSQHLFERHDGMVLERHLVVTNTPDLFSPALSPEEQDVKRRFHLSRPEPHALLLVLKSGAFSEQDTDALKVINVIFGEGASEYVIVVFMHEEQEYVSTKDSDTESVKSLLKMSRHPHHHLQRNGDQSQVQKFLESIGKMVEENGGHQLKIPEDPRPFLMKEDTEILEDGITSSLLSPCFF
uniref:AIG1-type G domain-containing protein n=2 Tax=Cyprinus carpio carpio TaxID=630221 RepID=A0A8C1A4I4_CYPCA